MKTVVLLAGIGGMSLGLQRAGHETVLLCESDDVARGVLRRRFRGVPLEAEAGELRDLPSGVGLVAATVPPVESLPAGMGGGAAGGLRWAEALFRLLRRGRVPWVVLEALPGVLRARGGRWMDRLVSTFEALGYDWAYRVVDARCFGLPQRRRRVYLVASTLADPRPVLLADEAGEPPEPDPRGRAWGVECVRGVPDGVAWVVDAVPALRGGTGRGLPVPPAIWMPDGDLVMPEIRDAERLQGLAADWTAPAAEVARPGFRWHLVGHSTSVPVADWLGRRLAGPGDLRTRRESDWPGAGVWPMAAAGLDGVRRAWRASAFPADGAGHPLAAFLRYPGQPLRGCLADRLAAILDLRPGLGGGEGAGVGMGVGTGPRAWEAGR